MKRSYL